MGGDNYCRWCGRKYDSSHSTASDRGYFCSKRCEVAAHRAGVAPRGRSFESHLDSCMGRLIIGFFAVSLICGGIKSCVDDNAESEEKQEKKASQRTEQVTKNEKQKTQPARQPMKQIELTDDEIPIKAEILPEEDAPQAAPKEAPVVVNEGQEAVAGTSVRQLFGEQAHETVVDEEKLEEVLEDASEDENAADAETVYSRIDQMPQFPGGDFELRKWIMSHLRYPTEAIENGIKGSVLVQCVVNRDGSISDAKIARGLIPACDKEALRLVNSMPRWIPGQLKGENVRAVTSIIIPFRLQ